ncbi:unnamed protein product, partial [Iphiclides podalirius]
MIIEPFVESPGVFRRVATANVECRRHGADQYPGRIVAPLPRNSPLCSRNSPRSIPPKLINFCYTQS